MTKVSSKVNAAETVNAASKVNPSVINYEFASVNHLKNYEVLWLNVSGEYYSITKNKQGYFISKDDNIIANYTGDNPTKWMKYILDNEQDCILRERNQNEISKAVRKLVYKESDKEYFSITDTFNIESNYCIKRMVGKDATNYKVIRTTGVKPQDIIDITSGKYATVISIINSLEIGLKKFYGEEVSL